MYQTCTFYILRCVCMESLWSIWQPLLKGCGGPGKNVRVSRQRYSVKPPIVSASNCVAPASSIRHLNGNMYTYIHKPKSTKYLVEIYGKRWF